MRVLFYIGLLGLLAGCYVIDTDGDGIPDGDDCAPHSALNECIDDNSGLVIDDTGAAPSDDTGVTGDTGDTGVSCISVTWYRDADLDGYGSPSVTIDACEQPDGYVDNATDCDDADATSYPGAPERCDGADNDCDGEADENASNAWYVDADGDGYGAGDAIDVVCDGGSGSLVDNGDDCDDAEPEVNPAAAEFCNDLDDDCDGETDEDAEDAPTWYYDADGDGHGDAAVIETVCDQPEDYVAEADDCDDADAGNFPGNAESCDGADNDCDGELPSDESDDDGDGYAECLDGDCDDGSSSVYPGAAEQCDGADNDCDGVTDESDASDAATWYADTDGDGYGDAAESWSSCSAPVGYVADATDCDDGDAGNYPGNTEVCDGADNDCDGEADNDASDATVWSSDADGDGYGDASYGSYVESCDQPDGYVADFADCDDGDASVSPAATEVYDDLVDNDCDGTVDNAGAYCCADDDGDGYGNPDDCVYEETGTCSLSGYVVGDGDCDDANASINPGAYESPYDTVDADCDGSAS